MKAPTRRGFGSTVIERSIRHDLNGESTVEYALAGMRAEFQIPARFVRLAPTDHAGETPEAGDKIKHPGKLPQDVLLVEDNLIIALDSEDMLHRLGVSEVRVASNVRQALRAIEERAPSFALLDVNLGTETSFEIAERLLERNIPFAFATGYGEEGAFPEPFSNTPKYSKPYTADVLRAALAGT